MIGDLKKLNAQVRPSTFNAANKDANTPSTKPVGGTTQSCPLKKKTVKARLVSVEFLNGGDAIDGTGEMNQFVNLPREAKWVDNASGIANQDRLSHTPRIRVKFDQPGSWKFKVKLKPDGGNTAYTANEKKRNARFTYTTETKEYTTDASGIKIIESDFAIPCAGNDKFTLEAEDLENGSAKKNSVSSVRVKRAFYMVSVRMNGTPAAPNINAVIGEYNRHHIKLMNLPDQTIARIENIGDDADSDAFADAVRAAYMTAGADAKEPYVVALGFTDQLAVKGQSSTSMNNVAAGPGQVVNYPVMGTKMNDPTGTFQAMKLWKDVVAAEDWFISCQFVPADGSPAVDIPKARCTPSANRARVSINLADVPAGNGRLRLEVNIVDRMRGGLSFGGGNLICACARAWWNDKSADAQEQVVVHELGHKVGMVSNADPASESGSPLPDRPSRLYSAHGHVGNHCCNGLSDAERGEASYSGLTASSTCVMFGGTNGVLAFCDLCTPVMKKLDLSAGWTRL